MNPFDARPACHSHAFSSQPFYSKPLFSKPFYSKQGPALFLSAVLALAVLTLSACGTTPSTTASDTAAASAQPDSAEGTATENTTTDSEASQPSTDGAMSAAAEPEPATAVEPEPVRIVESCKDEPYGRFEQESRASMAKGLAATEAGQYGVGFRNLAEHKQWSDTHKRLFTSVNEACNALSQCAQQHPDDKTTQCAEQASHFKQWQEAAERFAQKAKLSETTQPPIMCSFEPSLTDAADCFHGLADNIDKACDSAACKKTSDCWRSIGFLDQAIKQASSACGFARTPLAECRGYVTVTQRRETTFKRCSDLQQQLSIRVIPVL